MVTIDGKEYEVSSIADNAFNMCSALTSIIIPEGVTSIGLEAFCGCGSLTTVYSLATTPPSLGADAFGGLHALTAIYVHDGSVEAYKAATNWSAFADKITAINSGEEPSEIVLAVVLPNGSVNIKNADKNETPLGIVAEDGWKINTVTLGSEDITSQLGEDGSYTVPILTESKRLNVVFEQGIPTAVADVYASRIKVYAAGGQVRIEGAEPGAEVRLYDPGGQCLFVTDEHTFDAPVKGVTILTVDGRTFKMVL